MVRHKEVDISEVTKFTTSSSVGQIKTMWDREKQDDEEKQLNGNSSESKPDPPGESHSRVSIYNLTNVEYCYKSSYQFTVCNSSRRFTT